MTLREKIIDDLEEIVNSDLPYDPEKIIGLFFEAISLYPHTIRLYNCISEVTKTCHSILSTDFARGFTALIIIGKFLEQKMREL